MMNREYIIQPWLSAMVSANGSDLHIKSGVAPKVRVNGSLVPLEVPPLDDEQTRKILLDTMTETSQELFRRTGEADYAISVEGLGRFRVNAFRAQGAFGLILRHIRTIPYTLDQLSMPPTVAKMAAEERGLILVTGPTGSGKSTTLAAMIQQINHARACHILTIEDPVEMLHPAGLASITQREVRTDTADFRVAMRAAMRQDPDVILIGEMRDAETVEAAIAAAETGHLVLSTLHTKSAAETVNRVLDFFEGNVQQQIRYSLATSLVGIVCQRLIERADNQGRIPALEMMTNNLRVAEAIADPQKTADLDEIIRTGEQYGMRSFDQHLLELVMTDQVSVQVARRTASNLIDFDTQLKRVGMDPREYQRF